ncbi:MAG: alpha/beta fold hydrolase [Bacilli bacterium]|jgi:alpha-beta hydrolase superfamily lysophospholipase
MDKTLIDFQISQDITLKVRLYQPESPIIKGIIIIVHGMAEHIERYDNFMKNLADNNYVAVGYNQRGHFETIKNESDYGFISELDGFNYLINDLSNIFKHFKDKHPELPIFIFGHSMGSFITQRFGQLYSTKANGLILCGTGVNKNYTLKAAKFLSKVIIKFKGPKHKSKFIDNITFGSYNKHFKPNRTDYDWLNTIDSEVDKYVEDKYCGGIFSTAFFRDFFNLLITINNNNELISKDIPILLISGKNDPVGCMGKSVKKLYNDYKDLNIKDVQMNLYEGRHEILHDVEKGKIIDDIINWLDTHLHKDNIEL